MADVHPQAGAIPSLYQQPVALCGDAHRHHGLTPRPGLRGVGAMTAVPLGIGEFFQAARHYPIVFGPGPQSVPHAITGLFEERNLFVESHGDWREGYYVPGYLRRYPFILSGGAGPDVGILVIDQACERFVDARRDARAVRLFDDQGNPTALTREATSFCLAAYQEEVRTGGFSRALHEAGILVDRHVRVTLQSGQTQTVNGFRSIDENAYRSLPAATVARWFALGWVDVIAMHLASQQNWQSLVALHERSGGRRPSIGGKRS